MRKIDYSQLPEYLQHAEEEKIVGYFIKHYGIRKHKVNYKNRETESKYVLITNWPEMRRLLRGFHNWKYEVKRKAELKNYKPKKFVRANTLELQFGFNESPKISKAPSLYTNSYSIALPQSSTLNY